MGNSAQEHRVVTGLFAGKMSCSTWSTCTGALKVPRRGRGPDSASTSISSSWWPLLLLLVTLVALVQVCHHLTAPEIKDNPFLPSLQASQKGTLFVEESAVCDRTAGQVRVLLMLSGNVERNPGPDHEPADPLVSGLADLVGRAPPSMRDVLCVWAPDKPTNVIATELNSKQFTVSVLQPALAWLLNKDVSDPIVKSIKNFR